MDAVLIHSRPPSTHRPDGRSEEDESGADVDGRLTPLQCPVVAGRLIEEAVLDFVGGDATMTATAALETDGL